MKKTTLLFILFLFISCGKDGLLSEFDQEKVKASFAPAQAEDYSYILSEVDCTTGVQSFETFERVCEGLKDDKLNNFCAEDQREELFTAEECSGEFK